MPTIFEKVSTRVFTGEGIKGLRDNTLIIRAVKDGVNGRSWYLVEKNGGLSQIYENGTEENSAALVQLLDVLFERGELREVYVREK